MKTSNLIIFIYLNEAKTVTRVIKPSEKFDGSVAKLVESVTGSDLSKGIKMYHHYETV